VKRKPAITGGTPRTSATLGLIVALVGFLATAATAEAAPAAGERIYRAGVLPSGRPLRAVREGGVPIEGQAAACVNCHRRSGIGVNEGRISIPPISGKYLFRPGDRAMPEASIQPAGTTITRQQPYNAQTLVRAMREGVNADGRSLSYLMPRFELTDTDATVLVDYLKSLSSKPVPGVTHDQLSFATIVTPDADPVERDSMLEVLRHFFASKNHFERGHDPPLVSSHRIHYRITYKWQLHVWELTGSADTWEAQLNAHFRTEPVFAVISGVGRGDWAPIHRFCQRTALPCLFPNIPLPVVAEGDFYPVYFSRGVLLEADLIRSQLHSSQRAGKSRVLQVYRQGDIGAAAARALRESAGGSAPDWVELVLSARGPAGEVPKALTGVGIGDILVLWLRAADLRALPADPPGATIFASGLMGGLENAPLPTAWRAVTRLTYPVDLPQRRAARLIQPLTYFRTQAIPVAAERVQVDTYVACQILSEAVGHAFADPVPDYLIEQIENMVSLKLFDGYYPRLGLAPGQRFASKGGYLVRLAPAPGGDVMADSDWLVP
jgi:hypothetical protein